uniref:GRF-type domain-containing protein n=1 Tax=Astyanax mexicanus TaxID=7994 RepID=A0A8B9J462_ASTMX
MRQKTERPLAIFSNNANAASPTTKQVEAGLPLRICLSRFTRWLQTLQQEKGVVYVTDSKNTPSSGQLCTFITWSDWDLGVCLLYECKRKQIVKPEALSSWIDLRATYRTFYSRKPKGLNGALQDLGIQFSGREHSGLDDARNTARLAWRMVTDGCVLKITKSLNRAPVKSRPLFGQGRVHSKSPSKTRPPVDENLPTPFSNHSNGSSTGNPNTGTGTGVCQNLVPTRTVLTSLVTPVFVNTPHLHTTLQNTTPTSPVGAASELEMAGCDWAEGFLVTEVGESGSYDDVVLEDVDTINHSSHSSCYTNQSKLCSVSFNQSAPLSRCSGRRSLPLCRSDGENSLVTKLPRVTKVTAPLCSCGRRAKRMTVGNGGPNHGRAFYSCPVRKSGPDPAHRGGCGFFKWESAVINSTLKPNSRISFSVQTAASRNFR